MRQEKVTTLMQEAPLPIDDAEVISTLRNSEQKSVPEELYLSGDKLLLSVGTRILVVGSRKASERGLIAASRLASVLVKNKITVVSGLAEGVDTAAHQGAIGAGGKTIAVIATPLDEFYPTENQSLQNLIARNHLLVSLFPAGTALSPKNFVVRNRTAVSLSHAVVIVEADEKSGTVNTGWEAIRLGRPLWIMQSMAETSDLNWPREMIGYGARTLSKDTFEEFLNAL